MTHQVKNGSFGKVLAAAALGFMLSSAAPVQAQQRQWGSDNCLYARGQGGQMVRLGCVRTLRGHLVYHNFGTNVLTDLSTNFSYLPDQNGRWMVKRSNVWEYLAPVQIAPSAIPTPSTPTGTTPKSEQAVHLQQMFEDSNQRVLDRMLGPNCRSSHNGC
jgi:hypothetical protein